MRDLKRPNAKLPAYRWLAEQGFEVFTPMRWELSVCQGRKIRRHLPFLSDLLFVHSSRLQLDPVVAGLPTLQYRFVRGAPAGTPLMVHEAEMDRFIQAVQATDQPRYYTPAEITPPCWVSMSVWWEALSMATKVTCCVCAARARNT